MRHAAYGTAIKMYDYKFIGERSNILRGKSLLSRLDLLLPEIALPVRFYEYRKDKRGSYLDVGSRRTTVSGLLRRDQGQPQYREGFSCFGAASAARRKTDRAYLRICT